MFFSLSLTFVFFYYFLKFLVEFHEILLLLVHCSLLLRVAPKGEPCFLQNWRQTCWYFTLETGGLLRWAPTEQKDCVGLSRGCKPLIGGTKVPGVMRDTCSPEPFTSSGCKGPQQKEIFIWRTCRVFSNWSILWECANLDIVFHWKVKVNYLGFSLVLIMVKCLVLISVMKKIFYSHLLILLHFC